MIRLLRKRPGRVYAVAVLHPETGERVRFGYIGKSRQRLMNRLRQHAETQPWWDTVVGFEELWYSSRCSGLRLWWEEAWRIRLLMPLYNIEWNRLNPRRVKPWDADLRYRSPAYVVVSRGYTRQMVVPERLR